MKNTKGRNLYLDLFKIILAFSVVYLHFGNPNFSVFGRFAVPMFFMISGFFLFGKDNQDEKEKSKKFIKGSAKYLIVGNLICIALDILNLLINRGNIAPYIQSLFIDNFIKNFFILNSTITSGYHLWFLTALFVVSLIHFVIVKFDKTKLYYFIVPICLFILVFFDGYIRLFNQPALGMGYVRNALFMGLPLVGVGYLLAKFKKLREKRLYCYLSLILGIIFFGLQFLECKLYDVAINGYLTSILCAMCLLNFFVSLKSTNSKFYYKYFGSSMPYYIYVLHIFVGGMLNLYVKHGNIVFVLIVFLICFVLYEIVHLITILIKYLKNKKGAANEKINIESN